MQIIDDIFRWLKKTIWGWFVIVFALLVVAGFVVWDSLPDDTKKMILERRGGDGTHEALTSSQGAAAKANTSLAAPNEPGELSSGSADLRHSTVARNDPLWSLLTPDQVRRRIDTALASADYDQAIEILSHLPTPRERDGERKRIFERLLEEDKPELASTLIAGFEDEQLKEDVKKAILLESIKKP